MQRCAKTYTLSDLEREGMAVVHDVVHIQLWTILEHKVYDATAVVEGFSGCKVK